MRKEGKIRNFEDLEVWQLGKNLVVKVYELTKMFPKEERFGLVDQIRRSAISIPANIAESFGRCHYMDEVKCEVSDSSTRFVERTEKPSLSRKGFGFH